MAKVLQVCGVSQLPSSTFVLVHPSEILQALVGLKDVAVVCLERRGPDVELMRFFGLRSRSTPKNL